MRPVEDILNKLSDDSKANNDIWFKTKKKLNLKLPVKQQLLAYFSDYSLLLTGTFPHRSRINKSRVFTAILERYPGSLAIALISIVPSEISGTS